MKKRNIIDFNNKNFSILLRYLILLIITAFTLPLFYKILTPLTINASAALLRILYNITISNTIIIIEPRTLIQIIPACVAGSAYLLLLIFNLTVPMKYEKRIKSILLSFLFLFTLNIIRIFFLSIL